MTSISSRPCDGRLELTRILKENTDYYSDIHPFAYLNTQHHAPVMTIFRNMDDVDTRSYSDRPRVVFLEGNVETRVFVTPPWEASDFNVQVTDKYIHIS